MEAIPDSAAEESIAPMPLWKRLLPWVGATGVIYFLFTQVPLADAWDSARNARLDLFLPEVAAAVALWFLIESRAFAYLFTRFNADLSWQEARSLRGSSYLLTPINWNIGTAAVILHLRRSKKISALDSGSSIIFYGMLDGVALCGLALLGVSMIPPTAEIVALERGLAGVFLFQIVGLAIFTAPLPDWSWVARARSLAIFRSASLATSRDLAVLLGLRTAYFACFILIYWLGCDAFGIDVPLTIAAAATPAILMVGALPISPAGLGTQAAAMLYFFGPYGDDAAIVAFGLAFPVAISAGRCLLGLFYLKDIAKLRAVETGPNAA